MQLFARCLFINKKYSFCYDYCNSIKNIFKIIKNKIIFFKLIFLNLIPNLYFFSDLKLNIIISLETYFIMSNIINITKSAEEYLSNCLKIKMTQIYQLEYL